ncbi:hypothetical protein BJY00DRAFT_275754 [Aspergillus carlsbadensis]|nr:hypothetical protein BJY00DRAFT_275754 [Aspergillus carlsbadensis]
MYGLMSGAAACQTTSAIPISRGLWCGRMSREIPCPLIPPLMWSLSSVIPELVLWKVPRPPSSARGVVAAGWPIVRLPAKNPSLSSYTVVRTPRIISHER